MRQRCALILLMLLAGVQCSWASPFLLDDVPNYYQSTTYKTGCAPTTAAIILGYWDLHGYDQLFDQSGWENVRYTVNVENHISSPQHRAYSPKPGLSYTPPSSPTALTDFMKTSTGGLAKGWTYIDDIGPGILLYTASRGYTGTSVFQVEYADSVWETYMHEIDLGNPVFLIVDSDLDGIEDHAVAGIGYDVREEGQGLFSQWFAFYDPFSEDESDAYIRWYKFLPMNKNNIFGLYGQMLTVHAPGTGPSPAPEPATFVLLAFGLAAIAGYSRRSKASIADATTM